jgi:outer membrane protein assembly factor BamA
MTLAALALIAAIQVHGNHTTPDEDILAIAALKVGDEATPERLADAEARLRDSHRFEAVEIRRRYQSIADPSRILVILLVDEKPGVTAHVLVPGPARRLRAATMWLPILRFEDGYGFTYGARTAVVDALGPRSRISMPLTWGGERRAAVDVERALDRGPLSIVRATAAVDRRVNPHFNVSDSRREVSVQADRAVAGWLRVGGDARVGRVTFGGVGALHRSAGAHLVVDTRLDPSFPRNGVLASASIERLMFEGGQASRWSTDVRGYVGLYRGSVLAVRARTVRADTPLPPSEQTLLGGGDSLRGYRAGYLAADGIAVTSAEVRVPFTSPLTIGRFGAKLFTDVATTWPAGTSLTTRRFDQGNGGGIYFGAAVFTASADIAFPRHGSPRWHFGLGIAF